MSVVLFIFLVRKTFFRKCYTAFHRFLKRFRIDAKSALFMQGLNFVLIYVLFSSFIVVHSIASHDATSCRQFWYFKG